MRANPFRQITMSLFIFLTVVQALVAAALVGVIVLGETLSAIQLVAFALALAAQSPWALADDGRHGVVHRAGHRLEGGDRLGGLAVVVGDDDIGAVLGEDLGGRPAHAASGPDGAGQTIPSSREWAAIAAGSTPGTRLSEPSSASSPSTTNPSTLSRGSTPSAAKRPSAIGRS